MRHCTNCRETNPTKFYATSRTTYCKSCHKRNSYARQLKEKLVDPASYNAKRNAKRVAWKKGHVLATGNCFECSNLFQINTPSEFGRKKFCSPSCRSKWFGRSNIKTIKALCAAGNKPETRAKILAAVKRGPDHQNWIDGRSSVQRPAAATRQWRKAVFSRDNYTCQLCGEKGGRLQADHIQPYATHPALRWELSNGRTLCIPCHKATPTFAGKMKKQIRLQLEALTL